LYADLGLVLRAGFGREVIPGVGFRVWLAAPGSGIVDSKAKQVEVWRFAAGASELERHSDTLPVRLGDRLVGEILLSKIFDWPG
jgi:hypothetical protein